MSVLRERPLERALVYLNQTTHRLRSLPVLVLMPHSRCNCRCVMCDIWKANGNKQELPLAELERHVAAFEKLRVRWIVFSGGEALLYPSLWQLCERLERLDIRLTLLSTGLLLEREAPQIGRWIDEVIVSLDGPAETHDAIRRVPSAFDRLARGVTALREVSTDNDLRITARCVLQRANWRELIATVDAARSLGLEEISFLGADVTSEAFNRADPWAQDRVEEVALDAEQARAFAQLVEDLIAQRPRDFDRGFIAESREQMRSIAGHFLANAGIGERPTARCNAPWVSAVIEADGAVRPCFFHRPYGNLQGQSLNAVLNSPSAREFRRDLEIDRDPTCRRCVCRLNL